MSPAYHPLEFLQPNSTIALICTGSTLPNNLVYKAVEKLENYSLLSVYQEDTYQGTSAQRRADILLDYLFNDEIEMIWALRGGEGSADLLPLVHKHTAKIKKIKPKIMMGLSDYTPILIYFAQEYGWPTIHGPGLGQIARDNNTEINTLTDECKEITWDFLFGKLKEIVLTDLIPLNEAAKHMHLIENTMTGGNLSLIDISIKDIWELDTTNKIIILEDVGEKAHKVSRTLKYLQRIGKFDEAKAVILGDFNCLPIGTQPEEQERNAQAINKALQLFADSCTFPVLITDKIGHGRYNMPLPFNTNAQLILGRQPQLKTLLPI